MVVPYNSQEKINGAQDWLPTTDTGTDYGSRPEAAPLLDLAEKPKGLAMILYGLVIPF